MQNKIFKIIIFIYVNIIICKEKWVKFKLHGFLKLCNLIFFFDNNIDVNQGDDFKCPCILIFTAVLRQFSAFIVV